MSFSNSARLSVMDLGSLVVIPRSARSDGESVEASTVSVLVSFVL